MITRLTKEEYRKKRRELLTDIVYAITHDELKKMHPEHTELTPVEIYLSARAFAEIVLKLSDIDEGLDDEISDLQEDCKSEDEAMIILVVASIILEAMNKKNPSQGPIIKDAFMHRTNNDGNAIGNPKNGHPVSAACIVIDARSWRGVERQLGKSQSIFLRLSRTR